MKRRNRGNLFFQKPCLMDQMGLLFFAAEREESLFGEKCGRGGVFRMLLNCFLVTDQFAYLCV